jgi:hypothetical protein
MRAGFQALAAVFCMIPFSLYAETLDDAKDHGPDLARLLEKAVTATKAERAEFLEQLVMPDAATWFGQAFGPTAGDRGAQRYLRHAEAIVRIDLEEFFALAAKAGATDAKVSRWRDSSSANERDAFGVRKILHALKEQVSLYTIEMVRPDGKKTEDSLEIGVFVWFAGRPRFLSSCEGAVVQADEECLRALIRLRICASLYEVKEKSFPATIDHMLPRTKESGITKADLVCPCHPENPVDFRYFFPVAGHSAPQDSILGWCPRLHAGKRHFVTFAGDTVSLTEAEFDKKLSDQYSVARALIPELREQAQRRAATNLTTEEKEAVAEFLSGLDIVDAEGKVLLDPK